MSNYTTQELNAMLSHPDATVVEIAADILVARLVQADDWETLRDKWSVSNWIFRSSVAYFVKDPDFLNEMVDEEESEYVLEVIAQNCHTRDETYARIEEKVKLLNNVTVNNYR